MTYDTTVVSAIHSFSESNWTEVKASFSNCPWFKGSICCTAKLPASYNNIRLRTDKISLIIIMRREGPPWMILHINRHMLLWVGACLLRGGYLSGICCSVEILRKARVICALSARSPRYLASVLSVFPTRKSKISQTLFYLLPSFESYSHPSTRPQQCRLYPYCSLVRNNALTYPPPAQSPSHSMDTHHPSAQTSHCWFFLVWL